MSSPRNTYAIIKDVVTRYTYYVIPLEEAFVEEVPGHSHWAP